MDEFTKFLPLKCHEPQHFVLENPHSLVVGHCCCVFYLPSNTQ